MELRHAIEIGDVELVASLLRKGESANFVSYYHGTTALMSAVFSDAAPVEILSLLLEHGARVEELDSMGRTALSFAFYKPDKFRFLIEAGADPFRGFYADKSFPCANIELADDLQSLGFDLKNSESALRSAARELDLTWLRYFKAHNVDFSTLHWTPLMESVVFRNGPDDVRIHCKLAYIETCDFAKRTPLMVAVESAQIDVAEVLYELGSALSPLGHSKRTILTSAIESGSREMTRWVLDHALSLDCTDLEISLRQASELNHAEIVELLLSRGADPLFEDECQIQAINVATGIEVAELLMGAGADVNRIDGTGAFLLCNAVEREDIEFVRALLDSGADVNNQGYGMTALAQATNYDCVNIIKLLLSRGANPNAPERDSGEWQALCWAQSRSAAQILIDGGARVDKITRNQSALEFHYDKSFRDLFEP